MPCYDSRDRPENVRASALAEFEHNSPVAEMLCALCTKLEAEGRTDLFNNATRAWWEVHKQRDEDKRAREGARETL